jgi:hypothetical protein
MLQTDGRIALTAEKQPMFFVLRNYTRFTQFISLNPRISRLSQNSSQSTLFSRMSSVTCDPQRAAELASSLHDVQTKLTAALETLGSSQNTPTLIAVSKLKSVTDIMGCYLAGQREFGENYVNELAEKAHMVFNLFEGLPAFV